MIKGKSSKMANSSFFLALFAAVAASANASTFVAVVEIGKGGVVRRTTSKSTHTTVKGVKSFWNALHGSKPSTQHTGMTVVPDLFNKAQGGIVLGVSGNGVDLENMPRIASLVEGNGSVGFMTLSGAKGEQLMQDAPSIGDASSVKKILDHKVQPVKENSLEMLALNVDHEQAAKDLDAHISEWLEAKQSLLGDKTMVVHIVVEEEKKAAQRRVSLAKQDARHRRLEDEQEDKEEEEEGEEGEGEEDGEENGKDNGDGSAEYYKYGYKNRNGEWVSTYKTIFQIQYFNIVLWTSIGLAVALFATVSMMMYMPLEADTLLFGESAKMMGE